MPFAILPSDILELVYSYCNDTGKQVFRSVHKYIYDTFPPTEIHVDDINMTLDAIHTMINMYNIPPSKLPWAVARSAPPDAYLYFTGVYRSKLTISNMSPIYVIKRDDVNTFFHLIEKVKLSIHSYKLLEACVLHKAKNILLAMYRRGVSIFIYHMYSPDVFQYLIDNGVIVPDNMIINILYYYDDTTKLVQWKDSNKLLHILLTGKKPLVDKTIRHIQQLDESLYPQKKNILHLLLDKYNGSDS